MILSNKDIIEAMETTHDLVIKGPTGNDQIKDGAAQDDFVLESMGFGLRINKIRSYRTGDWIKWPADRKYVLQPGELVVVETYEHLALSRKLAATLHARARKSLMGEIGISTTIHPGWPGGSLSTKQPAPLWIAITNYGPGPIILEQRGEPVCRVLLHEMKSEPSIDAPMQNVVFGDADRSFEDIQIGIKQQSLLQKRGGRAALVGIIVALVVAVTLIVPEPLRAPLSSVLAGLAGVFLTYLLTK